MAQENTLEFFYTCLNQAEGFYQQDNYIEARSRLNQLLNELRNASTNNQKADAKTIAELKFHVEARLEKVDQEFRSWNAKIAARRQAATDNAEQEMQADMPNPPDRL